MDGLSPTDYLRNRILTPDHPLWDEFYERLEGPEGCNFQGDYDEQDEIIVDTVTWACGGGTDQSKSKAILETMPDIGVDATLAFFSRHGGHCDCEVLFNVADSYKYRVFNDGRIPETS